MTRAPINLASVICGLDGSPQSVEALRQAAEVAEPDARFWGVASWDPSLAFHAGIHAGEVRSDLHAVSREALSAAAETLPDLQPILMQGGDVACLLSAISNLRADLVCIGSHGTSRMAGLAFGSVATTICRHSPCTVLVAREQPAPADPPVVVVGTDGSDFALDAARVAATVAARMAALLVIVNVCEDRREGAAIAEVVAGLPEMAEIRHEVSVDEGDPVRGIVAVAEERGARLSVVGSRGLTGIRALGSTAEQVAHRAQCSTLIVRRPAHPEST